MRSRNRPIDLNGKTYFLAGHGSLVMTRQVGVDLHGRPIFLGGCHLYDERGNVIALQGRDDRLVDDDLVADILYDDRSVIPTEVLIAVAADLVEDEIQQEIVDLEVGEEMTPEHVTSAVDRFLSIEPRFVRFRRYLIASGVRYAIGEELS